MIIARDGSELTTFLTPTCEHQLKFKNLFDIDILSTYFCSEVDSTKSFLLSRCLRIYCNLCQHFYLFLVFLSLGEKTTVRKIQAFLSLY